MNKYVEYEIKYRTSLTKREFNKYIHDYIKISNQSYCRKDKEYIDRYFYNRFIPNYFMRVREEVDKYTLTFKEENGDNTIRAETNFDIFRDLFRYSDDEANLPKFKQTANILNLNDYFKINKEALIFELEVDCLDLSWYRVNKDNIFIEIEYIGEVGNLSGRSVIKLLSIYIKEIFGSDNLSQEPNSLFKLYKPHQDLEIPVCKL